MFSINKSRWIRKSRWRINLIGENPELEELFENSERKVEGNDDEVIKKIGRKIKI